MDDSAVTWGIVPKHDVTIVLRPKKLDLFFVHSNKPPARARPSGVRPSECAADSAARRRLVPVAQPSRNGFVFHVDDEPMGRNKAQWLSDLYQPL